MSAFRRSSGAFALFAIATAAIWFWLGRMGGEVGWLTVEAPRHAIAGESLPIRVHVVGLQESSRLCVDLHWSSDRDSSKGVLASGGSKSAGREGGSFDFEIMVHPRNGLRYVHGIVYLSPTGSWDDHTFVAATDLIPVATNHDGGGSTLSRLPVHQLDEARQRESTRQSPVLRLATGILLLAASVLAWMIFHSVSSSQETSNAARCWWLVLAAGLALACAWELLALENHLGRLARVWARAEDIYYPRAWFQRASVSAIIAAMVVALGLVWRIRGSQRVALFSFGLYLAISLVNLPSLHALDRYAEISWHGVSLIEALKFICAAATLAGAIRARGWTQTTQSATTE